MRVLVNAKRRVRRAGEYLVHDHPRVRLFGPCLEVVLPVELRLSPRNLLQDRGQSTAHPGQLRVHEARAERRDDDEVDEHERQRDNGHQREAEPRSDAAKRIHAHRSRNR